MESGGRTSYQRLDGYGCRICPLGRSRDPDRGTVGKKTAYPRTGGKIIGKKEFAANVGEFVTKKNGKPALVEDSDKRPAITNKISAAEAFKEETDHE